MTCIYFRDLDKTMNTIRTLIQLTTTLAACLQVSTIGIAHAARPTSNSTVLTVAQKTSLLGNQPHNYEPDPNGNPKSDGTGTR